MDRKQTLDRLVKLYNDAKASSDQYALKTAESAIANFQTAEGAIAQMLVAEAVAMKIAPPQ